MKNRITHNEGVINGLTEYAAFAIARWQIMIGVYELPLQMYTMTYFYTRKTTRYRHLPILA